MSARIRTGRRAENFGFIDRNPVPAVKLSKAEATARETFTIAEIYTLLAACPDENWQTLILLGFYVGARLSDCARMPWEQVDAEMKIILYQQQKTGKSVAAPVHADLLLHLGHISERGTTGPLCRSLGAMRQSRNHGLSEGFKRIVKRAGLDLMVVKGKGTRTFARRTFDSLRHSHASTLPSYGVIEDKRKRMSGHSSRDIHSKYVHFKIDDLQEAIDLIPARMQPRRRERKRANPDPSRGSRDTAATADFEMRHQPSIQPVTFSSWPPAAF